MSRSVPENHFVWRNAKPGRQAIFVFAGLAGLISSVGILPAGFWLQLVAAVVCTFAGAFTIWSDRQRRRLKPPSLTLVIQPDGSALATEGFASPVTETSLQLRFGWRGQESARLVFLLPNGDAQHWFLYRRDLNASQWRCLCRWIQWLERAHKPV